MESVRYLRRTPRAWPAALAPVFIALAMGLLAAWLTISRVSPWVANSLATAWGDNEWLWAIARWVSALVVGYASVTVCLALTPLVSGPALEHLVRLVEQDLGVPRRPGPSFVASLVLGWRVQAFTLLVTLGANSVLWLLGLMLPLLAPFTTLVGGLFLAVGITWSLIDYPLGLRGVPLAERRQLVWRNKARLLSFGVPFVCLFWLPVLGVALLPVGVVAATRLIWLKLPNDPLVARLRGADASDVAA